MISLLSLAFLILLLEGGLGTCCSVAVAVAGRPGVGCLWGDACPSLVEGLEAEVEGLTGCGASRVRFLVSALRSMAGHKSLRYSDDEEPFRESGSRDPGALSAPQSGYSGAPGLAVRAISRVLMAHNSMHIIIGAYAWRSDAVALTRQGRVPLCEEEWF